uniref:Cytochrome c oxidase subunit 3 n=1 Tax=Acavomonas peruviana TaxID=1542312 RepID=V5KV73_9ALVE|nr:cytochrome c oxidase subunit 3 [Acavomonas peruviana]AHA41680.1 cytochrome c oxidase subunit 3 [Acavomonas peruviana]
MFGINVSSHDSIFLSSYRKKQHPFHLVDPSPWPIILAFFAFSLSVWLVNYINRYSYSFVYSFYVFLFFGATMFFWFRDIIRESTFEQRHSQKVESNLLFGLSLFVLSEFLIFSGFFWGYFHNALSPGPKTFCSWPQPGIQMPEGFWGLGPIITVVLLSSALTFSNALYSLKKSNRRMVYLGFYFTIILGLLFFFLQGYEFLFGHFTISDGVYGSLFYMTTGLHGFHVFVGLVMIFVGLYRWISEHYQVDNYISLYCIEIYWHFVDFIWVFVFLIYYVWGNWPYGGAYLGLKF